MMYVIFFNDTATTEIYTLSLHDALPIYSPNELSFTNTALLPRIGLTYAVTKNINIYGTYLERSEEHTSELQSRQYLVCRLLLEKKKEVLSISTGYFPTFLRCSYTAVYLF